MRVVLPLLVWPIFVHAETHANSAWPHTVRQGDTLIGLVEQWTKEGTDWRTLAAFNRIRDPRRLQPGSTLMIPWELLREAPLVLEVLHSHGDVHVDRPGEPPAALIGGMSVRGGDLVRTGRQSSVSLRSPDGSRITLREGSALHILQHSQLGKAAQQNTELRLDKGAVDTQVQPTSAGQPRPRLQIQTPVVNLGVRGTAFRTRSSGEVALVEVLTGRVAAIAGGAPELAVQEGFGVKATAAGPSDPIALPPAPIVQGLPRKVDRLPLTLPWESGPAAAWRAQVHPLGQPGQVLLDGLFSQPVAQWPDDLPDGRYGLRLRAVNAQGLEGHDSHFEFELKARPEPPLLSTPADRSRSADAAQNFSWTGQSAAARYRFQLADNPGFDQPRVDRSDIASTSLTLDLAEGTQYWRVASVRADGDTGPWSDTQTTTRVARPPAPGLEAPTAQTDGQLLRWRAAPGMRFQLQVARDAAFGSVIADKLLDQPQWLLVKPEPGTYYTRVRSISSEGFAGTYGATQTLEIAAPPQPIWPWFVPWLLLLF